jgi:integrase/recombinase XerD
MAKRALISTTANGKRAKLISPEDQLSFLSHVVAKRHGSRNQVLGLLSFKAGLRACEIAGLDWTMVLGSNARVSDSLEIGCDIAKKGSGRRVPMHSDLRRVLRNLHKEEGRPTSGPVCRSERGGALSAKAVVNWFTLNFRELGLDGCSSHSGRRTMITMAARSLAKVGGSLRDVQELAGHRNLATTETYIQGDRAIQRRLIELI